MGLLYLLPVMLLFILTRNFLVRGMTATTKGTNAQGQAVDNVLVFEKQ